MTMKTDHHARHRRTFHYGRDLPNFPEVSGTSFPVLTTVLAGFALTIAVQLILRPDDANDLPLSATVALASFLFSILALIVATVFAINAQARNYLPFLGHDDAELRHFGVEDDTSWLLTIERQWYIYHWATLVAFYSGVALLLAGIALVVWAYVGAILTGLFVAAILLSFVITFGVALYVDRSAPSIVRE
jgi:hypothetical protein